jgi:O-antigen/teichoic acid export membrane protein
MSTGRPRNTAAQYWGVLDQAVSSATNFALLFVTVQSVNVAEFGAFSLVYLLYVLILPVARCTGTVPFTIRDAHADSSQATAAVGRSLDYVLSLGVALGLLCLAGTVFASGPVRVPLLVLAVMLPLLLVQDAVRGVLFARSRLFAALVNDLVWAGIQFTVLCPLLLLHSNVPVFVFVLAWAGGGALAGLYGLRQLHVGLRLTNPLIWLRAHADLARPLFAITALTVLPAQLIYLLMPLVSSLRELGSIRAVYVLFGPMNVAYTAAAMLALPYAVRLPSSRVRHFSLRISLALAGLSTVWGAAMVFLPAALGRSLIGPVWDHTSSVRLLLAISLVAEGVIVGPTTALSALGIPDNLAKVRYVTAPLTLVGGLLLAALLGARGVAVALMVGYSLTAVLAWIRVPTQPGVGSASQTAT